MKLEGWLIVTILVIGLAHFASSVTLFDAKIFLYNNADPTANLTADCKSNGADVGTFTVRPKLKQSFTSHVLVRQRSYATCSLTLGNLHGTFDVFEWSRDKDRCERNGSNFLCFWEIHQDALFLKIYDKLVLQYRWP